MRRVQFPGDERGFELHFLKNVPFKQVQVGGDLWSGGIGLYGKGRACVSAVSRDLLNKENDEKEDGSGEGQHAYVYSTRVHPTLVSKAASSPMNDHPFHSSATHSDHIIPKALVLHVFLSDATFLRSFDDDTHQRLMIDVFFNGTLASSVLVNWKDTHLYHQVFAGTRVENMAERPWVILPPGQNADGGLRDFKRAISVKERWEQICKALMEEVKTRGVNEYGERSPSADYLYTLAKMGMSEQVECLQKRGGRRFGVIDVVVTAGDGRKLNQGTSYLKKPTRLVDERYRMEEEQAKTRQPRATEQDAEGETDEEFEHEVEQEFEQESLTPAAIAPWPTMPLLPSNIPLPSFQSLLQLPQMTFPQPSAPVFPPFPVALLGRSSADSQLKFDSFSSSSPRGSQLGATPFDTPFLSGPFPILGSAFPTLIPSQAPRVSFGHTNIASYNPGAPPSERPIGLGITGTKMLPVPGIPTEMRPFAQIGFGGRAPVQFRGNPFDHRLNRPQLGPPPPVGFFSALPKPKYESQVIGHTIVHPDLPPLSFLLSCLIITGKNGKRIVDHRWSVAQRISNKKGRLNQQRSPARSSSKIRQFSPGSAEYKEASAGSRGGSRSNNRLTTPPPSSPRLVDPDMTLSVDKTKRDSIHDGQIVRNPEMPPTIGLALASISKSLPPGTVRELNKGNVESSMDDSIVTLPNTPTVRSRQATSQPFLSVQSPKARPFMFEDTEELLRRHVRLPTEPGSGSEGVASHLSRVSSILGDIRTEISTPVNPSSTPDTFNPSKSSSSSVSSAHSYGNQKADLKAHFVDSIETGSSDLSSAPNSPEVASSTTVDSAHAANASASQLTASAQPVAVVEAPVPSQMTKLDEAHQSSGKRRRTSFLSTAPASPEMALSRNHTILPTPIVSAPLSTLSTSPTKPSPKKKRCTTRPPPRIRDRTPAGSAPTTDNPPLNQDCSIAFAVTGMSGMGGTGSVLRQVKSERQGVFTEEEVVVGMRFFVAG